MKKITYFLICIALAFGSKLHAQTTPVIWADVTGATNAAGVLTKTAATGWTSAGATSSNVLPANTDGYIEYTVGSQRTFVIGLTENPALNSDKFNYAFYVATNGALSTSEGATSNSYGNISGGNQLKIERVGSQVKYYQNGTVLRTISVSANIELRVRALIYTSGGTTPLIAANFNPVLSFRQVISGTGGTSSTGSIDPQVVGGTSPYSYTWTHGPTTGPVSGRPFGVDTVTVTDAASRTATGVFNVGYKVIWPDQSGVSETDGTFTKTATQTWGNAGTISSNILEANANGWIEFVVGNGNHYLIGFAVNNGFNSADFTHSIGISHTDGLIYGYVGAASTTHGFWRPGDVLRLSREGSSMKYYKNGAVFKTETVNPAIELKIKTALYYQGHTTPLVHASFDSRLFPRAIVTGVNASGTAGGISTNTVGGTLPYTFSWSSSETTSAITGKSLGDYSVTVTDEVGRTAAQAFKLGYKVRWLNTVGVSAADNILTKTTTQTWGNAGGVATNVLAANTDGWVEFVTAKGGWYIIGFTASLNYNSSDFLNAIGIGSVAGDYGTNEASTAANLGSWQPGDVFRVSREGSLMKYYRNGTVVRSVSVDPALELMVKTALYNTGGSTPPVIASFDSQIMPGGTVAGTTFASNSGGITVTATGAEAPYAYSWSTGETTANISGKVRGAYTVTITDVEGRTRMRTFGLGYKCYWNTTSNITETDGVLTKSGAAGWNATADATNLLPANADGWIEFTSPGPGPSYQVGFGLTEGSTSYQSMRYGIQLMNSTGLITVYEGTTATNLGAYRGGDLFRISREGASIKYYKNGIVFKTTSANPSLQLWPKVNLNNGSAPVVVVSFDTQVIVPATINGLSVADSTGSITTLVKGGKAPYDYAWSGGATTSSISGLPAGTYSLTVTDDEGRTATRTYQLTRRAVWDRFSNVSENAAGGLTKDPGAATTYNAGAVSYTALNANTDGWVEFVAIRAYYHVGLTNGSSGWGTATFTAGLELDPSGNVLSNEGPTTTPVGTYNPGDVFRISREGGYYKYYKNDSLIRTAGASAAALNYKAAIRSTGSPPVTSSFEPGYLQVVQDNWSFQYRYDARKRMIAKKVPGADWVYMVYDKRDRVALTQDGNQRASNLWSFTKYDELNRPVMTGIKDTAFALTQAQMQAAVDAHYAKASARWGEKAGTTVHGYTNKSYPVLADPLKYLTVTYYDDYSFKNAVYDSARFTFSANELSGDQETSYFKRLTGQVTGTKVKVLDGGTWGGYTYLTSVNYYDDKYRVIQSVADNYKGGTDRTTHVYDFPGKVLKTKTTHVENGITWTDKVGLTFLGSKITKTLPGNGPTAGAASVQSVAAGVDCWVEAEYHPKTTTNGFIVFGLANTNPDQDFYNMKYAVYFYNSTLKVMESNSQKVNLVNTLVDGDVFRIERTGTTVTYRKNGVVFYTSLTASNTELFIDLAVTTNNSTIHKLRSSIGGSTSSVTRRMQYDHAGRLLRVYHTLDGGTEVLLSENAYNELGQLVEKKIHTVSGQASQSMDYRYNIRGWLTSMNGALLDVGDEDDDKKDLFGFDLMYNTTESGLGNTAMYNGNISGMKWSNNLGLGGTKQNGYIYSYDDMNRLTEAAYKQKSGSWSVPANNAFVEGGLTYDLNGNILSLIRRDETTTTMDNLTYAYGTGATTSNRLLRVTDAGNDNKGFTDSNNTGDDYTYDANGNMTTDQNKGAAMTYNFLNLPQSVSRSQNSIQYIYDATGRKLTQVVDYKGIQKQTDYAGEYQYEEDVLQHIAHEEGRIVTSKPEQIYLNEGTTMTDVTTQTATASAVIQNNGQSYLKATSSSTAPKSGFSAIGGTFNVTAGERYLIRAKGYTLATGSYRAAMWVRLNGADESWPGSYLPGTLDTESWTEQLVIIPAGVTTLTAGVAFVTTNTVSIIYLNDFEIVKLTTQTPEYQYNLKDHLGNVRLTFTTKSEVEEQTATMETANVTEEQGKFLYYDEAVKINAQIFDHTNEGTTYYSARLNGSSNERYGLAKSLSVMPGDTVRAEVYAKYLDTNSSNWTTVLANFMAAIAGGTAPTGTFIDGGLTGSTGGTTPPFISLLNKGSESGTAPKAYLNYLVFDRDYALLDGGFVRMTEAAREYGQDGAHEKLSTEILIKQAGYVYIYLSNDNVSLGGDPVEVYLDDFSVEHSLSPVIESTDFFPFGLQFNNFARESSVPNRYKFQGQEHVDDLGLGWDSFKWRNYMPDIGRFFNVDPLADKYVYNSPYAFAENKVITFIELEGLEGLHYTEKLKNGGTGHVIEKNVVVLTRQTSGEFSEKKNARIGRENSARVDAVRTELNDHYSGATNTAGEPVRFQFNVTGKQVENTASAGTMKEQIKMATENGLEGGKPAFDGGPDQIAPAAIVTTEATGQSSTNGISIKVDDTPGATAHEVGHTLMTRPGKQQESRPGSGGLMVDPPSTATPQEVDKFLKDAIQKKN